MRNFTSIRAIEPVTRSNEHGGIGSIAFRRLLDHTQFASNVDFVDATIVPPGSTIGRHEHHDSEELYYIVAGRPLMRIDDDERRMAPGDVAVVHPNGWHELINDTNSDVQIFVVQVRL